MSDESSGPEATMNTRKRWIRAGAVLSLFAWGCQTFQPVPLPEGPSGPALEGPVQVTTVEGERIVLRDVRVEGDALVGVNDGGRWAVPLDRVESVEERRFDTGRTVLATGLVVLIAVGIGAAIGSSIDVGPGLNH